MEELGAGQGNVWLVRNVLSSKGSFELGNRSLQLARASIGEPLPDWIRPTHKGSLPHSEWFDNTEEITSMRFYGKELGLRRRPEVALRTIIGGLVLLLLMAMGGCADAQPSTADEPTVSASVPVTALTPTVTAPPSPAPADVKVVYASSRHPLPWDRGEHGPLWGDLDAEVPIINRFLHAIADGTPVEIVDTDLERILRWTRNFGQVAKRESCS